MPLTTATSSEVQSKQRLVVFPNNIGPHRAPHTRAQIEPVEEKFGAKEPSLADPLPIGQSCTVMRWGLCHSKIMLTLIRWSVRQEKQSQWKVGRVS